MRAPLLFTPFLRSSHSSRCTGMRYSLINSSKTRSATCGSKIHIVRCSPSIAGVPCLLLPYPSRFSPLPGRRLVIMHPDAVVELPRQSADDRFVARVGEPQTAAGKASQMFVGRDDDDGL